MNHPYIASVPVSIFAKMPNETWQIIGNVATTTGLTACAYSGVKGVIAGYQRYAPSTSLAESEKRLIRVESRINGLSPERRMEIEIATRNGSPDCTSLEGLEVQLQMYVLLIDAISLSNLNLQWESSLMDTCCRLNKRYDKAKLVECHNPYSDFRILVSKLESDARDLLNDTLVKLLIYLIFLSYLIIPPVLQTTTVPHIDDIKFDPRNPRWAMARPRPPEVFSTPSAPSRDVNGALPYLRNTFV